MGKRILVVEDDPIGMELMRDILEGQGLEVIEARDGLEAVEKAEKELPALILMDIQLPKLDGTSALKRIKANEKCSRIPVIAVTAHAMKGYENGFTEAGFDSCVFKPFRLKDLLTTVERFLG